LALWRTDGASSEPDGGASRANGGVERVQSWAFSWAIDGGACMTQKCSRDCTHVIVDQYITVNEDLLDVMVTTKPFVLHNWLELGNHGSNLIEEELETHTILAWKDGKSHIIRQIDGDGGLYPRRLIH
ncbi:hypothetical protein Dimus_026536, partial [Dionaea muscipula]